MLQEAHWRMRLNRLFVLINTTQFESHTYSSASSGLPIAAVFVCIRTNNGIQEGLEYCDEKTTE
jgi:hypothetical protein